MQHGRTQAPVEAAMEAPLGRLEVAPLDALLPALARSSVVATLSVSEAGRVLSANERMCDLLGAGSGDEL
jgi:PAS domain-containing protein